TRLHLGDFWIADAQTATTVTQHRVLLVQSLYALGDDLWRNVQLVSQRATGSVVMWQELVEWWVQQTDSYRAAFHGLEQAVEVFTLEWQKLIQGSNTLIAVTSQDHLTHEVDTVAFEEHVLRTAKTNPFGTE